MTALSSGEMRKLLIFRALSSHPDLLILDEPFNGLDSFARRRISKLLCRLHDTGTQMVLITHRMTDIADFFTHEICLKQGRVAGQQHIAAAKQDGLSANDDLLTEPEAGSPAIAPPADQGPTNQPMDTVLIHMDKVTVRYQNTIVLDKVSWEMKKGENWAIIGPNGAGKTTLLKLITGDNLQGYANRITLFGRPKGTGESIWQIRQRIGYVADDLQARYQRNLTGIDVVCSGFFDSVGLYASATEKQHRVALDWMQTLDIVELAHQPLNRLSFGQQRLLLIARAMVKTPGLLILDEPCNGLDPEHREQVLAILDRIVLSGETNLLYVTHRQSEMPAAITHSLYLKAGRMADIRKMPNITVTGY
jgi:molybdate transport system ATP-binding protein